MPTARDWPQQILDTFLRIKLGQGDGVVDGFDGASPGAPCNLSGSTPAGSLFVTDEKLANVNFECRNDAFNGIDRDVARPFFDLTVGADPNLSHRAD